MIQFEKDKKDKNFKKKNSILLIFYILLSKHFLIFSLIFGGCCTNVFTLEAIIKKEPNAGIKYYKKLASLKIKGLLITFFQFLFITLEGLLYHFFTTSTFLIKRNIPLYNWFIIVFLFFSSSFLNNKAYGYGISIPIHIITQSGGTLITVILEWLCANKKFNIQEILAVLILTLGVIITNISNVSNISNKHSSKSSILEYIIGIIILIISQIFRSFMNIYMEKTVKLYSPNWREVNFYMHFFSFLIYIPILPTIYSQVKLLSFYETSYTSQFADTFSYNPLYIFTKFKHSKTFNYAFYFFINVITQSLCVQGINRLNIISTALTTNIILSSRKFLSLILSIYIFGNEIYLETILGVILVFGGGIWYSVELHKKAIQI
ncbi:uncharacterized protein T551_03284 [Pneumocystis jirovecii RU7]|uniref:Sugar phosphate transporter domain-containing protein n=1 Tax=Pneumocystis jirovecii (strain RU7) TaxID=1408657 RepID=A0A0W4ZEL1_PNEJ7|nr:uncharacterized protein T551_03284 [Pneumocystis jirovecii RU7]KTW26822.1 hypothetical protein T551_03284 [Pneumocystis jirovecii RU7]